MGIPEGSQKGALGSWLAGLTDTRRVSPGVGMEAVCGISLRMLPAALMVHSGPLPSEACKRGPAGRNISDKPVKGCWGGGGCALKRRLWASARPLPDLQAFAPAPRSQPVT